MASPVSPASTLKGRDAADVTLVGEVSHQESAVTISGLRPSHSYTVRVVAINQSHFSASSDAIRLQTTSGEDEDAACHPSSTDEPYRETGPVILVPYKAFSDGAISAINPSVNRDHSNSSIPSRRYTNSRRNSYSYTQNTDEGSSNHANGDRIRELTTRLDDLRSALQTQQAQDEGEEFDFHKTQAELAERCDDLRRQLRERDDQNKELNKSVKSLEHASSAVQIRKTQQEKAFSERSRFRERMREDVVRWEHETGYLESDRDALLERQKKVADEALVEADTMRAAQRPDLDLLVSIEEQIQERGKEVQELDREKKQLDDAYVEVDSADRSRAMALAELEWTEKLAQLQIQLHEANTSLLQTRYALQQLQQQIDNVGGGRRSSMSNGFPVYTASDYEYNTNDTMILPHASSIAANFELSDQRLSQFQTQNRSAIGLTNPIRTSSPFLPQGSHVSLHGHFQGMNSEADVDALTGGAMASPSPGVLLPSDLLGDDLGDDAEEMVKPRLRGELQGQPSSRPASSLSRPLSTNIGRGSGQEMEVDSLSKLDVLPGLGDQQDITPLSDSTPASLGSASPSIVSSPHGSIANLPNHKNSETNIDVDRRSVRSASGSSHMLPSTRRLELFSRQRGKTAPDEGPILGSLKPHQSQSMPRENGNSVATRSSTRHTSGLFGVLGRRSAASDASLIVASPGSRGSRPGSVYSIDNALPHPSTDTPRFGWGISKGSSERRENLHSNPWSPLGTRNKVKDIEYANSSLQHIESFQGEGSDFLDDTNIQACAPIGTKPKDTDESAQLNPNARDFTSIFGFGKKGDKADKQATKNKKAVEIPSDVPDVHKDYLSSPTSQYSKDAQESNTASSEDLTSEAGNLIQESPENMQPVQGNRGSLIRRITRKGSSGKFALPGQSLFSRKTAVAGAEDVDEDSGSSRLTRSVESIAASTTPATTPDKRGSAFSLSSLKRRSRKVNEAPSISEASLASETGDEDSIAEDETG